MKTGVIYNESNDYYHSCDAISSTMAKLYKENAPLYHYRHIAKKESQEEKDCFRLGSLTHCVVLERETFSKTYKIIPASAPRKPSASQLVAKNPAEKTVEQITWWRSFRKDCDNKTAVSLKEVRDAIRWKRNILKNKDANALLSNGRAEVVFRRDFKWAYMQCRVDWLVESANQEQVDVLNKYGIKGNVGCKISIDLKTIDRLSNWDRGDRGCHIYKYGYHFSQSFYRNVMNKIYLEKGEEPCRIFLFIVIEKSAPFDCIVTPLSDRTVLSANNILKDVSENMMNSYLTNNWHYRRDAGIVETGISEFICQREEEEIFGAKTYEDPSQW